MRHLKLYLIVLGLSMTLYGHAQNKHAKQSRFPSYKGLVMAGYQGWFNAKGDGADRGWNHYGNIDKERIGVEIWPEIAEYEKTYKTPFKLANGDHAYLFSSYDESSVKLHFKWMQQYGIDGVFVQRFVSNLKYAKGINHNNKVLSSALEAAEKYKRAIAIMYDFSGMHDGDEQVVIEDFKKLVDSMKLTNRGNSQSYLYHNGKPLVALWGVGFNDNRKYSLKNVRAIIDFLQKDPVYGGCSILLGVPTQWRELAGDTEPDPELLETFKKIDIIHPWFVGRFIESRLPKMMERIKADLAWCKQYHIGYVPVVYPGFSWHNMKPESPLDQIPRNKGQFFWKQLSGSIQIGAEMLYVAMFDEVDEGTAIFKVSKNPPVGVTEFVKPEEGIPSDYYLYLSGYAGKMLRKEIPFQNDIPAPKSKP
ncbi:glycoside hydrolase family 71/99-like protein [Pedobacter sp. MC2016-24]|uniref:glycoside hydrolase family 71/99-like protein n=1 Tax=Pedobacter sp. MC2016-24 TaxID=2780090 RepID=UPI0018818D9E|nr:glycoside hydrolase family 71/99-like protein [Pedobacter sp. MC2016-24]MBE9601061.1 xylosidase [Pedobacter sp. MC2016-24]